jgi:hypothetical protein
LVFNLHGTLESARILSKPASNVYLQQDKLITVTSDTNILQAMQLMTGDGDAENGIWKNMKKGINESS